MVMTAMDNPDTIHLGDLNPGIRKTVAWLMKHGFETCDSGDGRTNEFECDLPVPYVHILVPKSRLVEEADRLKSLLEYEKGIAIQPMDEEISFPSIQAHYNPADGSATVSLFNVML